MRHNYLVSVFVSNKNVYSFFSKDLDDLVTIRALYRDGDISIFDLSDFSILPKSQVDIEVRKSGLRWKRSLESKSIVEEKRVENKQPVATERRKKQWERPVLCVETGQVFKSIRECSDKLGIPYMTICNCIKNRNATRGVHFSNIVLP